MKLKLLTLIFISCFVSPSFSYAKPLPWRELAPGLAYSEYQSPSSALFHLFRIDPKKFKIEIGQAKDFGVVNLRIKDLVRKKGAYLGINASFFDSQFHPLGLVIQKGKLQNPLKPVSWWGVFSVDQENRLKISSLKEFKMQPSVVTALQAGPRLVEKGAPLKLKSNLSKKSFLAITSDQKLIIGATENFIDAIDLATLLAQELKVREALNLDGGGSTQLYGKVGNFEKELWGRTAVANGVLIFPVR